MTINYNDIGGTAATDYAEAKRKYGEAQFNYKKVKLGTDIKKKIISVETELRAKDISAVSNSDPADTERLETLY